MFQAVRGKFVLAIPLETSQLLHISLGENSSSELDIPIGLINSSWGGTNIETWISWDMMALEEEYKNLNPKEYEQMAKETQGAC